MFDRIQQNKVLRKGYKRITQRRILRFSISLMHEKSEGTPKEQTNDRISPSVTYRRQLLRQREPEME